MRGWKPIWLFFLMVALAVLPGVSQEQDDHGNEPSPLSATFIEDTQDTQLEGQIETVGDVDCFMIEAATGGNFTFEVTEATGELSPLLLLLDRDGISILEIKDSTADALANLAWKAPVAGFYFVCVRNAVATQGTGDYTLAITNDTAPTSGGPSVSTPQNPETPSAPEDPTTPPTTPQVEQPPTSGVSVALVSGDDASSTQDVQSFLFGTGSFSNIEIVDATAATPSLAEISDFSAVLVWADNGFHDPAALGDVLADYVDQGGGVVVAAVSFDANSPFDPDAIEGRFADQDYYVIEPGTDNTDEGRRRLGQHNSSHPIMNGVTDIDGGPRSFHSPTTSLTSGGSVVASWDNGDVLVAVKTIGQTRRADLNIFPPSGRVDTDLWPFRPSNQVPQLFANALLWVSVPN